MISFTDHNFISKDVYSAFLDKKTDIKLIIGIEVDTYFTAEDKKADIKEKNYKHVIFYFDDAKFNLEKHSKLINDYLQDHKPIVLNEFLEFLICNIKVPFLISPHFMKQDKRGFDFNWNAEDAKQNLDRYIDQMCCFWEASNNSNIQHAIDFLKEFDRGDKVSIISFSDSNNFEKLEGYLRSPKQYFYSLPSFEGLRMAGTDCRRISFKKDEYNADDDSKFIGKVIINNSNAIYFSRKLNSVIGGRGNGKSLLIDGLADYVKHSELSNRLPKNRLEYLKTLNIKVFDLNGNDLKNHAFNFDYFNQGFAIKIFENNNDTIGISYFKERFDQLKTFDIEETKSNIRQCAIFELETKDELENISRLDNKIILINNEINDVKFSQSIKEINTIEYNSNCGLYGDLVKKKVIPNQIKDSPKIKEEVLNLQKVILDETFIYNKNAIENNFLYVVKNKYKNELNMISKAKKEKNESLSLFEKHFTNSWIDINNRVKCINAILNASTMNFNESCSVETAGFEARKFEFKREIICENLLKYLFRIFDEYFDARKLNDNNISKRNFDNLYEMIEIYCSYPERYLQESKHIEDLDEELFHLKSLKVNIDECILVKDGGKIINLKNVSPGTRANYLLEYIVFNETSKPLLIDQPEDNIDNATIFNQLTKWFNSLKQRRQVIVVTHDANIVVNSDSENVIICQQTEDNHFEYNYGALEYADNLDKVSKILDGGREAIERRLLKYGE